MNIIPFKIRIDPERYSDSSKRSVGHGFLRKKKFYTDIEYVCRACSKKSVYPAIEQKKAYENRKEYMWSTRVLCETCWRNKRALLKQCQEMEKMYCRNKSMKLKDEQFLRNWLNVLIEYSKYSCRYNKMRIRFIKKHLEKFGSPIEVVMKY